MSPEQLRGEKLDFRSDIFSIGVVFYELLCGHNPFVKNDQAEIISAILNNEPGNIKTLRSNTSQPFISIIQKCLKKDKKERFQSAAELLTEVKKVKKAISVSSLPAKKGTVGYFAPGSIVFFLILSQIFPFLTASSHKSQVLAIMPITNTSLNGSADFISDGLTENLINSFSRLKNVKVLTKTVVSSFKSSADTQRTGRELGADLVLTGNLTQAENNYNLLLRLVRVSDGIVLRENQYRVEGGQLLSSQEKIFSDILIYLNSSLSDEEKKLVLQKPTDNEEAAKSYFQGRYFLHMGKKEALQTALDHFKSAIDHDPAFALAWSGLSDTYTRLSLPGYANLLSSAEALKYAKAAAKKALEFDSRLSEPHASLGRINLNYEWNWQDAEIEFIRAIALKPDYSQAHLDYSRLLVILRRFSEAEAEARKAREYDPFSPSGDVALAQVYYYRRDYERALFIFNILHGGNAENSSFSYFLGLQYLQLKRYDESIALFEEIYAKNKALGAAPLGYAYAKSGRKKDAEQILSDLTELSRTEIIPPQEFAILYIGLGKKDKAFEKLQGACNDRFPALPFLLLDPLFEELNSDPRFIKLKQCANLPV